MSLCLADGLGSIRQLVDVTGTVIENYDYDPYGKPSVVSSVGNPIMFTGRWLDKETGNYYYRARQYSPITGRFLQRDPIGYWDSMNLYQYVRNNVPNAKDPKGTNAVIIGWTIEEILVLVLIGYVCEQAIYQNQKQQVYVPIFGNGKPLQTTPDKVPDIPYPGDDPNVPPGEDFEWKGKGSPDTGKGNWVNGKTGERYHPDLNHPAPKGPHWGYNDGKGNDWDIFPDGSVLPN